MQCKYIMLCFSFWWAVHIHWILIFAGSSGIIPKRRTVSNPWLQNLTLRKHSMKESQCVEAITSGDRLSTPASETFEATNKRYTCSRLVILEVLVGGLMSWVSLSLEQLWFENVGTQRDFLRHTHFRHTLKQAQVGIKMSTLANTSQNRRLELRVMLFSGSPRLINVQQIL